MWLILLIPIYLFVNCYMLYQLIRWTKLCFSIPYLRLIQGVFIFGYSIVACSPAFAFFVKHPTWNRFFQILNNYWLGIFLYTLFILLILGSILFILKHSKWKKTILFYYKKIYFITGCLILCSSVSISIYGIIHAKQIYTTYYEVTLDKSCNNIDALKIALISDLHLGYNTSLSHIQSMVQTINKLNVDMVCIAGDIFDNNINAISKPKEIISTLQSLQSTYGTYACFGNHDRTETLLAGFQVTSNTKKEFDQSMLSFLETSNITLLSDTSLIIDNAFYLVGRKDASIEESTGISRKSAAELAQEMDTSKPIFVMDHQPDDFFELSTSGMDLDLSGHTHNGQMFPGNIVTHLMWKNSYGYKKIHNLHSIVTSGVGVWGPNMRVGTKSEVVCITVNFSSN